MSVAAVSEETPADVAARQYPTLVIRLESGRPVAAGPPVYELTRAVASERGHFATSSWRWDGARLHAKTSRRGLVALYYATLPDGFVISPSIRQVMAAVGTLTIDRPAMLLFHLVHHYVDDMTPYAEIRVLPLGAELTWEPRRQAKISRPAPEPPAPWTGGYEAALRRYDELVRAAVTKHRGSGRHTLGLSGGRDSRHILLALHAAGRGVDRIVTAHHYLTTSYADVASAQQLARRLGMEAEVVMPHPNRVATEIAKNWLLGLQSMSHSWGLGLALALGGTRSVYDGMNGGGLLGQSYIGEIERKLFPDGADLPPWPRRAAAVIDATFGPRAIAGLPPFLRSEATIDAARAMFTVTLGRYAGFISPMQAFRFYETGPRDVALGLSLSPNDEVLCPLEDEDCIAFDLGLPWHISIDDEFRDQVLLAAYPAFADVPFEVDIVLPPGPPLIDPPAENEMIARVSRGGENETAAPVPGRLPPQKALSLRQIQVTVHQLQVMAAERGGDMLLGLAREELPPMPPAP